MADPRVLVLRAAGINCDLETAHAFEREGALVDRRHINEVLENPALLGDYGFLAIPGGFSYGDDVAAGKVLAVELSHTLGDALRDFVARGGLVLGICNGFQVLIKTGLLPGSSAEASPGAATATITWNDSHRYEDRWVRLSVDSNRCVFAPKEHSLLSLPVAHGEGRFTMNTQAEAQALVNDHQAVFRYVTPAGGGNPSYPDNPNGSLEHIAGICDPTGQVLGLMPHPERALFSWHHPSWTREPERKVGDGSYLFKAAVQAMR